MNEHENLRKGKYVPKEQNVGIFPQQKTDIVKQEKTDKIKGDSSNHKGFKIKKNSKVRPY